MKARLNLAAACLIAALGMANAADNARQDSRFRMTLSPESGDGADANLILSFSTPDHLAPRDARVLINAGTDGRNACFVYYSHGQKEFRLIKNSGAESFSLPLKADGKLENAQCSLDVAHSWPIFRKVFSNWNSPSTSNRPSMDRGTSTRPCRAPMAPNPACSTAANGGFPTACFCREPRSNYFTAIVTGGLFCPETVRITGTASSGVIPCGTITCT